MSDTEFKNSYKEIKIQTCICFPTKTTKEKQSYKYISHPNDCETHHQITNVDEVTSWQFIVLVECKAVIIPGEWTDDRKKKAELKTNEEKPSNWTA